MGYHVVGGPVMVWIGVDFDGTLAEYYEDRHGGSPVPAMVERVRYWIRQGIEVRLFTARATEPHGPLCSPCSPRS